MCSIQTRRVIEQASMALKFWARGTERMEFSRHRKDYGEKHTFSPISFQILPLPHFLYFLLLDSSGEKKMLDFIFLIVYSHFVPFIVFSPYCILLYSFSSLLVLSSIMSNLLSGHFHTFDYAFWF